jgi:glutaryl-CoA dehydrogenase
MICYKNLFGQFSKIRDNTIGNIVYSITKNIYSNSDLINFNESKYKKLYSEWGKLDIFNHTQNEITPLQYGIINYNIEKIDSSLRSAYSVQSSLVINPIEKFGSPLLQQKYLPKLYKGDYIGCFGLTESQAGSDPKNLKTFAKLDNSNYIVNGSKLWITNAPIADIFVIWCKDENNDIIGLVTEKSNSIKTSFIKDKLSLLASPTGAIYFDNLQIPIENKLNISGLKGPFDCLNKARYGIAWGMLGVMENCIDTTIDYCDNRKQFNKSLTNFQLIQNDIVKCIELYNNTLNNLLKSTDILNSFEDLNNNITLISFLKRTCCENALNVSRICRDILGANGISNNYNIMRHLINLEAVNTYEGTKNIHNLIIGRNILNKNAF